MNVIITHNGNDISNSTIRYTREHKICTGIGMLELEVDYSLSGNFDPWDTINIYENGRHKGKYFVSSSSEGQPNSTIIIEAQDNSKRLSDYFISDSYIINYPSYSRFWIEFFLDEVGINYTFLTDSDGELLSNNTALGLMTAYEQIVLLLQMNGWYITFSANGTALIGKLTTGVGGVKASLTNRTIEEIKVIKSDRMLRNRVVVWGNGDPTSGRWVFADVSKSTRWDYDSKDKRTIVISNSNIRHVSSAFLLANRALSEFARLTVEKHLTIDGPVDAIIGNIAQVKNRLFTGTGVITTIGSSMSKDGLITNIVLDERCPRFFNFFDFTGYVYVGTFGSGVWRKFVYNGTASGVATSGLLGYASGILPSTSVWSGYYDGLSDMNVTDLHVNAGILSCVTSSGQLYYNIEDELPWTNYQLSGLQVVYSGSIVEDAVYSGLMGRACIIDRTSNNLRYAVDTRSGINYGDFLLETDPLNPDNYPSFEYDTFSGYILNGPFIPSGIMRSWVLNVSPYDGSLMSQHSINVSGNFDFLVFDIENDGFNDYVEAMTLGSGQIPQGVVTGSFEGAWTGDSTLSNSKQTKLLGISDDDGLNTLMSYSGFPVPILQMPSAAYVSTPYNGYSIRTTEHVSLYDDLPNSPSYAAYVDTYTTPIPDRRRLRVGKFYLDSGAINSISYTATDTVNGVSINGDTIVKIDRTDDAEFNFVGIDGFDFTSSPGAVYYNKFDIEEDAVANETLLSNIDMVGEVKAEFFTGQSNYDTKVVGDYLYHVRAVANDTNGLNGLGWGFDLWFYRINLLSGGLTKIKIFEAIGTGDTAGKTSYGTPYPVIFQNGYDSIKIICPYLRRDHGADLPGGVNLHHYYLRRFSYPTDLGMGSDQLVLDWGSVYGDISYNATFWDVLFKRHFSNTGGDTVGFRIGSFNRDRFYFRYAIGGGASAPADSVDVICDYGDSIVTSHGKGSDELSQYKKIFNIRGNPLKGVAQKLDDTFTYLNMENAEIGDPIIPPSGVELITHLGTVDTFNGDHFWEAYVPAGTYIDTFNGYETISLNSDNQITRRDHISMYGWPDQQIYGNFRVTGTLLNIDRVRITYVLPSPIYGRFPIYQVLQRNEDDFNVLKSGIFRDRLDISNYAPLVTMDRRISSLETFYVSQDGGVLESTHPAMSGYSLGINQYSGSLFYMATLADDFRYSDFEDTVESGSSRKLLVVYSGDVGSIDISTLDSFSGLYLSPSGVANRIEISNYYFPDQYIFLSVSGYVNASGDWGFFEKPPSGTFVDYSSGYPQARTTIIRMDDRL